MNHDLVRWFAALEREEALLRRDQRRLQNATRLLIALVAIAAVSGAVSLVSFAWGF